MPEADPPRPLRLGDRQVFYIYNAMGVEGQDKDVNSLLAYCETPDSGPAVAAALFAALHLARTDIIMEPGMVRFYDQASGDEVRAFRDAFQQYEFKNPNAISELTRMVANHAPARGARTESTAASCAAVPASMSQIGGSSASTRGPPGPPSPLRDRPPGEWRRANAPRTH
jgi:hypothetical protein